MATAGSLKDRVAWYPPVRTLAANRQAVVTFPAALKTTYAEVKPVMPTSGETLQHGQQVPRRCYHITLRSRTVPGLAADWRAVWTNRGGAVFEVFDVKPHPNGEEFLLVVAYERPPSTQG